MQFLGSALDLLNDTQGPGNRLQQRGVGLERNILSGERRKGVTGGVKTMEPTLGATARWGVRTQVSKICRMNLLQV